jgi:flagellar motor switch protein FliN/FliY
MAKKSPRLTDEEVAELLRTDERSQDVEIRRVEFAELGEEEDSGEAAKAAGVSFLWDIPLTVEVVLGETELTVREVMEIGVGSVVELNRSYGEPVDVYLNGRLVARGEVVTAGEQFGVKIKEILVSSEEVAESSE